MFLTVTLIITFLILILLIIRLKSNMAALVAWIVGSIAGSTSDDKNKPPSPQKSPETTKGKSRRVNKSKKKSPPKEPTFSTNLTSPIEDAIEETLSEEKEIQEKTTSNKTRKRKSTKSPPKSEEFNTEDIGFSFFKTPSSELIAVESQKIVKESSKRSRSPEQETPFDNLGFSFLPVKDKKSRRGPKTRIDELPKSSLIDHFQPKRKHVEITDSFVFVNKEKEIEVRETSNKDTAIKQSTEIKESKKVHSKISYASVTAQSYEERLRQIQTEEDLQQKDICIVSNHFGDKLIQEGQTESVSISHKEETQTVEEDSKQKHKEAEKTCLSSIEEKIVYESKPESTSNSFKEETKVSEQVEAEIRDNLKNECNKKDCYLEPNNHREENLVQEDTSDSFNEESQGVQEVENKELEKLQVATDSLLTSNFEQNIQESRHKIKTTTSFLESEQNTEINNKSEIKERHIKKSTIVNGTLDTNNFDATLSKSDSLLLQSTNQTITESQISHDTESFIKSEIVHNINAVKEEPFKMSSGSQIRVLTLNDKEHQESTLYRIEKNWILQFRLGPSLFGRKVSLYCNYPRENDEFNRTSYHLLKWSQDLGCNHSDDTALLTEIIPSISGSFHYYFTYENADPNEHQGSGFFLVDPVLKYGKNEILPLDCIQCQTVLAKSLGPFDTWENKLRVAKETGYNMIHFTPIQELGVSNSSYSLSNQHKVNSLFKKQNGENTSFDDINQLITKLRSDWKITSICDIVLNHAANESEWLQDHPEATYNCVNCPYLRPAYLLDAALYQFSRDIAKGVYEDRGIPTIVCTEDHLNSIRYHLNTDILSKLKIHEMFICDVDKYVTEFLNSARNKVANEPLNRAINEELVLIQDPQYRRLASTIDMKLALKLYNTYRSDCFDEDSRVKRCSEEFKAKLESLNQKLIDEITSHLNAAIENSIAGIRYFRVQHDGPKIREVTLKNPLLFRYFTDYGTPTSIKEHEVIMYSDKGKFLMAHNGWVMNSDPLRNFAAPGSNVYIRRELIAWGDSVKLRYGDKPEDCPYLWNYMKEYVEQTAKIFDGVRLDNCHSTPINVAEYLLDCARKIRPDLYVVAELFTNSDMTDNIFVNRLGITSLIREAMSAWDSHEEGRLVYRYGGYPVGSFYQPRIRPLVPTVAHALFLDLTHDNPSPVEKRSVFDLLPSTGLVNMACCASGSNRGYDELVPHHIHVVDETRLYTEWSDDDNLAMGNSRYVTSKSGIIAAKKAINQLHYLLGAQGFNQVYVDQMDPDIVAVTRHNPETHESYVMVAFTAFGHPTEDNAFNQRGIRPLKVEGVLDEIVLEATLSHISAKTSGSKFKKFDGFSKDSNWINGLSEYQVEIKEHIQPEQSEIFEKVDSGTQNMVQLNFKNFKPGSVAVIKVSLPEDMRDAVTKVRDLISQFSIKKSSELTEIISEMTLADLNRALYRCDQEERDEGNGFDTYDIPNFGKLVYAGLQGFMSLLSNIRPNNDLGHPLCGNLRDGNWMIDYIWQRLKLDEGTKPLGQWFEENTKPLKAIPRYLIPCYFDAIITGLYIQLLEQSYNLMSDFVKNGSTFVRALSLGSLQFGAYIKSADLPELSPNLAPPKPPKRNSSQACVTLSAGLPHFAVGYMRNWGRDTFIALRGLFILTGRYQEARYHILGYAACLRHGLIPNLLDGGRNPRFNCRDAIWWWLYCIKCYVEDAPQGLDILQDKVSRIFPTDDSPARKAGEVDQKLCDVIQEALETHFQGLVFRERNAGRQIDEHMTDHGFNNQIGIHPETGFVFGGNAYNCGTWMDKMGSSDKAGIRGKPATPRDGSAVELVGLSKACVTWLAKLHEQGVYAYDGVTRTHKNGSKTHWSFKEWADKIKNNFERCFWINTTPLDGEIRPDLINKRGIYKDCFGASQEWTDFQLRCNFPIAMVVAPELFDAQHAWTALKMAEKYLLGPLGMRTLDPEDWAYNGDYDNSNDSDNPKVAHGFNYHQGPEWVWPIGFYLRAKLQFAAANNKLQETLDNTKTILSRHFVELQTSTWRGLPELTNSNGSYCRDSSRTQAWSMSCVLEVLHDLQKIEQGQPLIN